MNDFFAHLLFPLSIGGVGGFLIGYAMKKVIKILLVFLVCTYSLYIVWYMSK